MTSTCIFCKRRLVEHSPKEALSCFENIIRGENIDCALKLCNGIEVADITIAKNDTFPHLFKGRAREGKGLAENS